MDHPAAATRGALTCNERYARGLEVLRQIGGPNWDVQLRAAAETTPDLAWLTVEFGYGDLISRPGLALPPRFGRIKRTTQAIIVMGPALTPMKNGSTCRPRS